MRRLLYRLLSNRNLARIYKFTRLKTRLTNPQLPLFRKYNIDKTRAKV